MKRLSKLNSWEHSGDYYSPRSAQGYLNPNPVNLASSGCGSSCGSKDGDEKPKPSACGAGDEGSKPKPIACGSSCGSDGK